MYNQAFSFLPERYRKPTTKQLYYVVFKGFNDIQDAITSVQDSRDIDKATGKTLDLIGGNVGQIRIDEDDDLYRLLIKTRIIANLSNGDIPVINKVMSILVKDVFLGLQEVWKDKTLNREPAAIQLNLSIPQGTGPVQIINNIKSAGVRVLYQVNYPVDAFVGSGSMGGEVITILPPPMDDLEILDKTHVSSSMYSTCETITIKPRKE